MGPERSGDPGNRHPGRRLRRRVPLPDRPADHHRQRARPRPAGHLRRRARLGALSAERVRGEPVGRPVDGRRGPRPGRGRLPGDRCAPPGEGVSRLVERYHPRRDALRGGPRIRRPARGAGWPAARIHRPVGPGRGEGRRPAQAAALPGPGRSPFGLPGQRARPDRWRDRRPGDERGLRLRGRAIDRLRLPAARQRRDRDPGRDRGLRPRGSASRSPPNRCTTRPARGSGHDRGAFPPGRSRTRSRPGRPGAPGGPAPPTPSSTPGSRSPWPPATRPTRSPWVTSGATSR